MNIKRDSFIAIPLIFYLNNTKIIAIEYRNINKNLENRYSIEINHFRNTKNVKYAFFDILLSN